MRGPTFEPITFSLDQQDVGLKDEDNVLLMPLVAVPISEDDEVKLQRRRHQDQNRLLYAMLQHPSESYAGWADACGWKYASGPAKSKVERLLKELAEDKLVKKYRKRYVLTELGRKEAEKIT